MAVVISLLPTVITYYSPFFLVTCYKPESLTPLRTTVALWFLHPLTHQNHTATTITTQTPHSTCTHCFHCKSSIWIGPKFARKDETTFLFLRQHHSQDKIIMPKIYCESMAPISKTGGVQNKNVDSKHPVDSSQSVATDSSNSHRAASHKGNPLATTNDSRRPIRRGSLIPNRRSSWDLNTDWDAMEHEVIFNGPDYQRRTSIISICSNGSQGSYYHVLDGFGSGDIDRNRNHDQDDGDSVDLEDELKFIDNQFGGREGCSGDRSLYETIVENDTVEINGKVNTKRRNTTTIIHPSSWCKDTTGITTTKVKRKSLREIMILDEESFSASLASLSLSQARSSSASGSYLRLFESSGSNTIDHDFSSYFNDEDWHLHSSSSGE